MSDAAELLTSNEVARLARVSPLTVNRWARNGYLHAIKVGGGWRFRRTDVESWLEIGASS